jgi:hypothetical protein
MRDIYEEECKKQCNFVMLLPQIMGKLSFLPNAQSTTKREEQIVC